MADYELTILSHYNLTAPYPTEWPTEKDESDASDEDLPPALRAQLNVPLRRSKSKFSALERSATGRRSLVPGSQKTRDGFENLVQKDEADPLGKYESVVGVLRSKGLPVDNDQHMRASGIPFTPINTSYTDHCQAIAFCSRPRPSHRPYSCHKPNRIQPRNRYSRGSNIFLDLLNRSLPH